MRSVEKYCRKSHRRAKNCFNYLNTLNVNHLKILFFRSALNFEFLF